MNRLKEWLSDMLRYFILILIVALGIGAIVIGVRLYNRSAVSQARGAGANASGGGQEGAALQEETQPDRPQIEILNEKGQTEAPDKQADEAEAKTEGQTQARNEKQAEGGTEKQTELSDEPQVETQLQTETQPQPEAQGQSTGAGLGQVDLSRVRRELEEREKAEKTQGQKEAETKEEETKPESEAQPQPESEVQPQPESEVQPQTESETQPQTEEIDTLRYQRAQVKYAGAPLNIRTGPGTEFEITQNLEPGTSVQVTGQTQNWYRVRVDGTPGYIYKGLLVDEYTPDYRTMTGTCYLRSEADYGDNIIGEYPGGTTVEFLEDLGGWVKVRVDGQTGYMGSRFVGQ